MHFNILFSALYLFTVGVSAAAPSAGSKASQSVGSLNAGNNYGAPIPPWQPGAQPGWYYGNPQKAPSGLICLVDNLLCGLLNLLGIHLCPPPPPSPPSPPSPPKSTTTKYTTTSSHTTSSSSSPYGPPTTTTSSPTTSPSSPPYGPPPPPPPPPGYTYTYDNFTCATEVWPISYYISFGKVETMEECAIMCSTIDECLFANSYHDNNAGAGKDFTELLTCSLFKIVTDKKNATNCGGQQQQNKPVGTTFITDSYGLKRTINRK
ncbi:fruit-body specific protein a [Favolaschia claudopus]|uniref:Fruit-body specific protein a n=1 Tax=Favolaschia claudopus TaxID=2862362 RepID=A0AAW0DNT2_9AGAR